MPSFALKLAAARSLSLLAIACGTGNAGCLKAVEQHGDHLQGPMSFTMPPGWRLARNYRWFGGAHVVLDSEEANASLSVELLPAGKQGHDIPLGLMAEIFVGNLGRSQGVETVATAEFEVLVANTRGVALVGTRRHGPQSCDFTSIVARTRKKLLFIMLQAPPGSIQGFEPVMRTLMDSLLLPGAQLLPDTVESP